MNAISCQQTLTTEKRLWATETSLRQGDSGVVGLWMLRSNTRNMTIIPPPPTPAQNRQCRIGPDMMKGGRIGPPHVTGGLGAVTWKHVADKAWWMTRGLTSARRHLFTAKTTSLFARQRRSYFSIDHMTILPAAFGSSVDHILASIEWHWRTVGFATYVLEKS